MFSYMASLKFLANPVDAFAPYLPPMTPANKKRYTQNHSYNRQVDRTAMINAASTDTFGFDCVCLIKGVLWGWRGDKNAIYGGATYTSNGVPDIGADTMYENATEKGTIDTLPEIPGLALWHSGHIGIYIGGGKVIHAANTHAGVIISDVSGSGFTHWLKIPYITYTENTESQ